MSENKPSISIKDAFATIFNNDVEITKRTIKTALRYQAISIANALGTALHNIDFEIDISIKWNASGKELISDEKPVTTTIVLPKHKRHDECPSCSKETVLFKLSSIINGKDSPSWLCRQCVLELVESNQAFVVGTLTED